jgi:uncharacterized protein YdeI (YjbR/CyaY-like superfamily)
MGSTMGETQEVVLADAGAWDRWLSAAAGVGSAVWLVLARKGTTEPTRLTYDEALEAALCHGWIDGQRRSRDATTFLQRFSPRRPRSPWSVRNTEIAQRLISEGRMQSDGLAEIERARRDGRWDAAYAGPATMEVPADPAAALDAQPRARAMFDILTSQNRFAVVLRVGSAKRPETRARRIETFVAMLERGETVYPQRRRLPE